VNVPTPFNRSDPSTYNMNDIGGLGLKRSVNSETGAVTYAYPLREYRGPE
jgi:hypothetical protein